MSLAAREASIPPHGSMPARMACLAQEFLPEYGKYGRAAPLKRNLQIIEYADLVLAFWDGESRGTAYVIRKCREMNVPCKVYMQKDEGHHDD